MDVWSGLVVPLDGGGNDLECLVWGNGVVGRAGVGGSGEGDLLVCSVRCIVEDLEGDAPMRAWRFCFIDFAKGSA